MTLGLEQTPTHEKTRTARPFPRRLGNDDSPNVEAPAPPWLRPRAAHQAYLQRLAPDRRRLALPGSSASAQRRVGQGGMGRFFNQPPRSDLHLDSSRRQAPPTGGLQL